MHVFLLEKTKKQCTIKMVLSTLNLECLTFEYKIWTLECPTFQDGGSMTLAINIHVIPQLSWISYISLSRQQAHCTARRQHLHTKIEHQRIASFHYIIRSTMATRAASAARWCRRRRCPLDAHRVGRPHLVGAAIHRLYSYSCPGVYNAVKSVVQAVIAIAKSVGEVGASPRASDH